MIQKIKLYGVIVLAGLLAASGAGAEEVDSETCLACHDGLAGTLARGPHRLSSEIENPAARIECVSCHSNGSMHIEDPSVDNIGNPSRTNPAETNATCTGCHQPHIASGSVGQDPHIGLELACTSCHSVHGEKEHLLVDERTEFCGGCHVSILSQFRRTSNHPVTDGNVTCLSCHDFKGGLEPNFGHGGNANCVSCHPQQSGPYLHEHEAGSSFSTEGAGCVACHNPHGSQNDRLLNQPDDRLCFQCHALPPRHRVAHGGLGEQFDCMECHSAVHGSDDNRNLLSPQLGSRIGGEAGSCYCHNVFE